MRLRERVEVIVEAGQRGESVGEMVWDVSDWDDPASTWSGIEPTWVALDGWEILSVRTQRGRDSARRRNPAGTATVQLGWRSPADKWSFRPTSPIQMGQEMRVRVQPRSLAGTLLGDALPIYRGAVRDIDDGWQPDPADVTRQRFTMTISLTDRFADLGAVDLPEQALTGAGDTTDERLARIFDLAGMNTYYLRAAAGVVTHQSSNFARNLLDEAQVSVESETGDLYVDREGFITFRERVTSGTYPREDAPQVLWANTGLAESLAVTEFGTGQSLDDVVNQVSMAKAGGVAYTAGGPLTDSAIRYGLRTYQRFDLTCQDQADVEFAADYWLSELEDRTQRIRRLETQLDPSMADDQLTQLLDIELRDMHQVSWTDGVQTLEGTSHVQGVSHQITGTEWRIGVSLWAYASEGLSPAPARWGSARWGVDPWG